MAVIAKSDIQSYVQLSENLAAAKLNGPIELAHELDLKRELGAALYKAFIDGVGASTAIYVTLLNGESYTNSCGDSVDYPGIKPALCWFAYVRYLEDHSTVSTARGVVLPTSEQSQPASDKAITRKIAQAREAASHYMDEVHTYLCEKEATYTLYKGNSEVTRRGKVNIKSVG